MHNEPQTLADWLERIERAHPHEIELGLERVGAVAARMGLDRTAARVITVAGTNGKGSCVAAMERLLISAGRRVGAYTSPHLVRYNERVRVQGIEAGDDALCAAFAAVERARAGVSLTYFEFGTLAALEIFRSARPDYLLLEVGLGGRLDAVNIIDADIAIISSIQIDHVEWLGADRESIAAEKAGVFRAGRPAVCADRDPPRALHARAAALGAPWYGVGEEFDCAGQGSGAWHWRGLDAAGGVVRIDGLPGPRLLAENVAAALQALALCGELPAREVLERELPALGLAGRFETRSVDGVEWVLDVAHNPSAVRLLVARLQSSPVPRPTTIVFGAMRDKDIDAILAELLGCAHAWLLPQLPQARAEPGSELAARLAILASGARVQCTEDIEAALQLARQGTRAGERVLVCGSFHTVGPAREWLDRLRENSGDTT